MTPQLLTVIDKEELKTWTEEEWAKWVVEMKWDGARLIYHKGKFLSRTGKPLNNLNHIGKELAARKGWTFDGEIAGADWASTMSAARSSEGKKDGTALKFHVFDAMLDDQWVDQSCPASLITRRHVVMELCSPMDHVSAVGYDVVGDYHAFEQLHAMHLKMGCDGTVLKRRDSLYEFKRTKTWLKVKPVETYDGFVVGFHPGRGKYQGLVGALEVDFDGVRTFVSGMDDRHRSAWWSQPSHIVGKTIEVAARGKHKSGCLIEPRFIRIREDK